MPRFSRPTTGLVPPHLTDHAAVALACLIADNRAAAIARGARAVPPDVSRALQGFFPEALLRKCRLTVGAPTTIRLPALRIAYGDKGFVTLGEIVCFNDEHTARTDFTAWAHALTHVMQHERWGADTFARMLVADRAAVEREATENAARFMAWHRQRRVLSIP